MGQLRSLRRVIRCCELSDLSGYVVVLTPIRSRMGGTFQIVRFIMQTIYLRGTQVRYG